MIHDSYVLIRARNQVSYERRAIPRVSVIKELENEHLKKEDAAINGEELCNKVLEGNKNVGVQSNMLCSSQFVFVTIYHYGNQIKYDEVCGTHNS